MADNNVLKGMWCFNNEIDLTAIELNFNFSFYSTADNVIQECTSLQINQYGSVWYNWSGNGSNVYFSNKWSNEGFKTIVVAEGQEDLTDVLAFLQANANKVNWDVVYSTPEDYLYSIASLQQGMSDMLVNQGGTKPQYASIEQYATSLIDLRKEFTKLLNSYGVSASESEKIGVEWANKFRTVINNYINDNIVDLYDDTIAEIKNSGAFAFRTNLKTIEMTEVKELHNAVFWYPAKSTSTDIYKEPSLQSVKLPKLTYIRVGYRSEGSYPTFGNQRNMTTFEAPLLENIVGNPFYGCASLDNLSFPVLDTIDDNYSKGCFKGCTSLKNIYVPKLRIMRESTFSGCTLLETIDLPSCTFLGYYAFQNCTSLKIINIPLVENIRWYDFSGCTSLQNFDFSNIKLIDGYAFQNCDLTGEINLPVCTEISGYVFQNNRSITKIYAPELITLSNTRTPNGVNNSSQYNFGGCTSLVEVDFPKLSKVGSKGASYTFSGCTALKIVNLPLIPEVYVRMFENCTGLEEIDLPSALSCGQYAFYNCTNLKTIKLNSATTLSDGFINGCTSLEKLELRGMITLPAQKISNAYLKEVYLDNAETLGSNTFSGCTALTKVYMPKITSLPTQAFYNAGNLSETDFSNITTFGDYLFRDSKIINGFFPNLITMTHNSFKNCTALLNFEAPLLENMSTSNFSYCTSLQTAHLGKIPKIPTYTFERCTSLTDIYLGYDGLVTLEGTTAFTGTTNQQPINVHVKSEYADLYTNATNWSYLIKGSYNMAKITIVGDYSD